MKEREVDIGVSARHLHLTQDALEILFGAKHQLTRAKPGTGQFLSTDRVKVVGPKKSFETVAILGPCRTFNQFELSATDARMLGIQAPIRMSGDIEGTPGVQLIGPAGTFQMDRGVIIAKRHIHMCAKTGAALGLSDGCPVGVIVQSTSRSLVFGSVICRVDKDGSEYRTFMHIDTDEGNAAGIEADTVGTLLV